MMEQINVDTSLCVDSLLPHIVAHFDQVKKTFSQIDKLESAVKKVEKSVSAMETELNTAEAYLESESVFKTVFKPFLVTKTAYLILTSSHCHSTLHCRNLLIPPAQCLPSTSLSTYSKLRPCGKRNHRTKSKVNTFSK